MLAWTGSEVVCQSSSCWVFHAVCLLLINFMVHAKSEICDIPARRAKTGQPCHASQKLGAVIAVKRHLEVYWQLQSCT